jgi:hypothetical protein
MGAVSPFETLTIRNVLIQERTERFISDLRRLVQLLDVDIEIEEKCTGIFDLMNSDCSVSQKLRARRENLIVTISRLEATLVADDR